MGECQLCKEGSGLIDVVFIAAKMKSRGTLKLGSDTSGPHKQQQLTHNNILGDILRTKEENKNMVYIQPWMARVSVQ